jgi:hypothetical protein
MNEMRAGYVGELNRKDGLGYYQCPLCGDVVFELDLERYEPETGEGLIECCTTCRENFEADESVGILSDMLVPILFERFRGWAQSQIGAVNMHTSI